MKTIPRGIITLVLKGRSNPLRRDSLYVANYLIGSPEAKSADRAMQCLTRLTLAALRK